MLLPSETKHLDFLALSHGTSEKPPLFLEDSALHSRLPISWVGSAEEESIANGLIKRSRRFKATITAEGQPGRRAEEIRLLDGEEIAVRQQARWEIVAAVQATPPGLIVPPSVEVFDRQVLIRDREGQPFRILEISADLPGVESNQEDGKVKTLHSVRLTVRPESATLGKTGTVFIKTDHPMQPIVEVAIFVGGNNIDVSTKEETP